MRGYGTYLTHCGHFFQDKFENLSNRSLDHTLPLWTNEKAEEHKLIKDEIEIKSAAANAAQTGVGLSKRFLCRSNRHNSGKTHRVSNSAPVNLVVGTPPTAGPATAAAGIPTAEKASSNAAPAVTAAAAAPPSTITWQLKLNAEGLQQHQAAEAAANARTAAEALKAKNHREFSEACRTYL